MKETTALNQISRIVEGLNYKTVYIEIQTKDSKYTFEKEKERKIGFESGTKHLKVGR